MLQYVVIPPRRSTAEAFQILISHMFGDAGSPYLVGVVSVKYFLVISVNVKHLLFLYIDNLEYLLQQDIFKHCAAKNLLLQSSSKEQKNLFLITLQAR